MLKGKTVVLGVTGSIAAYKAANIASMLKKLNADVHVIMTKNAENIINPITFDSLTGHKCITETFDRNHEYNIAHIALADRADVLCIAPASANIIGKLANGIADDMLSTTAMAFDGPVIISPAMNTKMYNNPALQENLEKLKSRGMTIIPPDDGRLACGAVGSGKMPAEGVIVDYITAKIAKEKDLAGKRILVTAGPTVEAIDPVRYITNHSTGKMGYAIARAAMLRGAAVTLVSGPVSIAPPPFVRVLNVVSAEDMFESVSGNAAQNDIIIKAAAVADYTPANTADEKIKKSDSDMSIELKRTTDILKWLGSHKKKEQVICGFSMETSDVLKNSAEKLAKKNIDAIAANSLREDGAGFGTDTNHLTLIEAGSTFDIPMMSKEDAADILLTRLLEIYNIKNGRDR
ncbi:MAG TPA: bifunctional phosphopantothenoylcysteine decarboxylase/phosphopantothenate--cysteine ligase CoaBC [Candidatus Alectryocaccobium stercorigallinarum]|nr:bifunctional phosphopantothenoylcysteine decarboxylase/phosphopantothenate--cysteine ligase CoaBC [Candidatus Alectryocaccobium stercorigallinarum]